MSQLILVVDDSEANRFLRARSLRQAGFEVLEAATGSDAVQLASRHHPALVLLDIRLPDTNGFAVCRRLKSDPATASIPVLHISTMGRREHDYPDALESGSDGYLQEPVETVDLLATISALLRARAAEERAVAAEHFAACLLDSTPEACALFDAEYRFKYLNAPSERLFARSRESLIGKSIWEEFPATVGTALETQFRRVLAERIRVRFEYYAESPGVWFQIKAYPTPDSGFAAHFADITRAKRKQEALQAVRDDLEPVLTGMDSGLIRIDPDFRITYANPAAERLLGAGSELRGMKFWETCPALQGPCQANLRESIRENVPVLFECVCDPGRRGLEINAIPTRSGGLAIFLRDITSRRLAEQQLRRANERLELAQLSAKAGTWSWDLSSGSMEFSPQLCVLFGLDAACTPATLEVWQQALHREDREAALEDIHRALREHSDLCSEYRVVWPDGQVRWLSTRGRGSYDEQGRPLQIAGIWVDVTEQKQAEQALLASEERFRFARRVARCGVWEWEIETRRVYWSDELYELTGLDKGAPATLDTWRSAIHPDDWEREQAAIERVSTTGGQYHSEYRILRQGEIRWVESIGDAVMDAQGKVVRMVGIALDITDRRRAEENLRESEDRLRLAIGATELGTFDYHPKSGTLISNEFVRRHFGLAPDVEADYQTFWRGLHPEDRSHVDAAIRRALTPGGDGQYSADYRAIGVQDGVERWIAARGRVIVNAAGEAIRLIGTTLDVTDRKRTERELEVSRERLSLAHVAAGIGTWERQPGKSRPEWPPETFMLFGIRPDAPDAFEQWHANVAPEDRAALRAFSQACWESGSAEVNYRYLHPSGETRWFREMGRRLPNGNLLGVTLDISESRQREEALRNSERIYRAIGESIEFGVWICTPDGRNIYASESFLKFLGITQEQCSDFGWGDLLHPDDSARTIAAWKECVRMGGIWDIEHRFRGADGAYHPILARGVPVRNKSGEIVYWAGINLDIRRLKQAELALREAHERLNLHIDHSPLAVVEWNSQFCITRWAGGAEHVFGWSEQEALGRSIDELPWVYPEDRPVVEQVIADLISGRRPSHVSRNRNVRKDGRVIHCEWYNTSLRDAEGRLISVFSQVLDVTERKHAEEALERSNRELEQFSSIVSHDLRTPLRTISAFSELLGKEYAGKLGKEADTFLNFIGDAVRRMRALIDSLLAYARIGSEVETTFAEVDCSELLAAVLMNLRAEIDAARAEIACEPLPAVLARGPQIEQVLQNLIGNAIKYRGVQPLKVHVSARREGTEWIFAVRDNGMGFPAEDAERIFQPFERIHSEPPREGTGMGLAICKRVLERHGGRIWAESVPGSGSTFYFSLPAATSPIAQPA